APNTWLPQPNEWDHLTAEAQLEDPGSMLSLYREALEHRKSNAGFSGEELEWYGAPAGCFAFRRKGGGLICALNTSGAAVVRADGRRPAAAGHRGLAGLRPSVGLVALDTIVVRVGHDSNHGAVPA